MNAKTQKLELVLKALRETKTGVSQSGTQSERISQTSTDKPTLLIPLILASESRSHGIRELKSPLSE